MSILPSRSSVEGMTKEEIATACHTTLVHIFTGILVANNLLEERADGLYAFTESAMVDEGDVVEVEEEMAEVAEDIAEETPLSVQDMFQVPRLRVVEEESDPDSSPNEVSIHDSSPVLKDSIPMIKNTMESRRTGPGFTKEDHELMIQHSLTLDPRFLIIMDAENIAMNHGCHLFFSVRGIQIVRDFFEKRGHKVVGFVPEYCLDERDWSTRWEAVKKKLKTGTVTEDDRSSRTPDDMAALKQLKREGVLSLSPSKDYSDSYAIEYAKTKNGIIITNDRFNDAIRKIKDTKLKNVTERWLRTYVISYSFVGDDFIPNPDYKPPEYYEIDTE